VKLNGFKKEGCEKETGQEESKGKEEEIVILRALLRPTDFLNALLFFY
jgi:hypothetical protein